MRRLFGSFTAGVAALSLGLMVVAQAAEVSLTSVPKPVLHTVKTRFKNAMLVGASEEKTAEGKAFYEVSLKERGRSIDVTLSPEGAMSVIEKQIARKELPKPMADTLSKRYPGAKYTMFEQVFEVEAGKETLVYYEAVLIDSGKQTWAVELALDAKVRKIDNITGEAD